MTSDGKRTCTLCRERKTGCLPVNNNPAVYCLECRATVRRAYGPKLAILK